MSSASIRAVSGGEFAVEGDVVFATASELLAAGNQLFAAAPSVSVDLTGVKQLDSAALALVIEWLRQAEHAHKSFALIGIPEKLLAIARLTGAEELIAK
ncbi:MAG: STAS domain-containing protein [Gammaproteobacteria bacterium]|jgi:phospholipid transport system transporter-binding protein|nr:STAS domain-containing protein [Gammaproteobacteria bacterium]